MKQKLNWPWTKALTPYVYLKEQLSSANNNLQAKDKAVKKLQEQVCALESSLASKAELPSVGQPGEKIDLHREVFDYLPGTVNTRRGAATYESRDQAFPFHKQVRCGDRSKVPDLKVDSGSSDLSIPQNHRHLIHQHQAMILDLWRRCWTSAKSCTLV